MPPEDGFPYPPFTLLSKDLALGIVEGDIEGYAELLSVNGHAHYRVERAGAGAVFTLYWASSPKAPGAEYEWRLVMERVAGFRYKHRPEAEGVEGGLIFYKYYVRGPDSLYHLIADARRVAGIVPAPPDRLADTATGYPSRTLAGDIAMNPVLEEVLDLLDGIEGALRIIESNLYVGPIIITQASNTYGIPKATLYRILRHMAGVGAAVACPQGGGRHVYYVNLRSEVVFSVVATVFAGVERESVCTLLPYIEGVGHRDWAFFPASYAVCREVSMEMRGMEPDPRRVVGRRPC